MSQTDDRLFGPSRGPLRLVLDFGMSGEAWAEKVRSRAGWIYVRAGDQLYRGVDADAPDEQWDPAARCWRRRTTDLAGLWLTPITEPEAELTMFPQFAGRWSPTFD